MLQLHLFSDTSEKAYGARIYLTSTTKNRRTFVGLLCAKARLVPLNTQEISHLELYAALLSTQPMNRVKKRFQSPRQASFLMDLFINRFILDIISIYLIPNICRQQRCLEAKNFFTLSMPTISLKR